MKRICLAALGALSTVVVVASPAGATVIAYDGFESYTAGGALNGGSAGNGSVGANGEFGWTSSWSSLSGTNVQSAGGTKVAEFVDGTNGVVAATRGFAPQTGTVYFSVRVNAAAGLEGSDFLHFYLSNAASTATATAVTGGSTNANSGGIGLLTTTDNLLGARVGGTNGGTTVNSATSAAAATTYLLVGKLSKSAGGNYDRIDLYIDPTSSAEPGTAAATGTGDAGISQVQYFAVRTFNFETGDKYQFDDVRIGTTFADVVPEPGTGAVIGAAALGLLTRRRRRATV